MPTSMQACTLCIPAANIDIFTLCKGNVGTVLFYWNLKDLQPCLLSEWKQLFETTGLHDLHFIRKSFQRYSLLQESLVRL